MIVFEFMKMNYYDSSLFIWFFWLYEFFFLKIIWDGIARNHFWIYKFIKRVFFWNFVEEFERTHIFWFIWNYFGNGLREESFWDFKNHFGIKLKGKLLNCFWNNWEEGIKNILENFLIYFKSVGWVYEKIQDLTQSPQIVLNAWSDIKSHTKTPGQMQFFIHYLF